MSELFTSLKADLLDRRLLPVLVLLGAILAAAIAYAVLGGGSSSSSTPVARVAPNTHGSSGPSLSVSATTGNQNAAVAETTEGTRYQHHSGARNPFTPLTHASSSATAGAAASSSSASSSTSSSQSSSTPSGESGSSAAGTTPTTPATPAEPTPPAKQKQKPKTIYVVNILYGPSPTTPGQLSQLTPYAGLKRLEPLPSASDPKIVFSGVSDTGKGAIFTLVGEAILKGEGGCMPSATQCEAVVLAAGQIEEFDYVEANGQSATYELKVVSIAKRQASAASAARLNRRNRAGVALVRRLNPAVLKRWHFSSTKGVLVYVAHHRG
ncbi:MAG TPA: hypothetical protein VGL37_01635 [Solirubrobacteraceae bacterium]|jgi:hypothetical protein